MFTTNDRLPVRATAVLIAANIIGVRILSLPRELYDGAGPAAWMSVIVAFIVSFINTCAIVCLGLRYPDMTLAGYTRAIVGKFLSKVFGVLLVFYLTSTTAMVLGTLNTLNKLTLLDLTPFEVINITFLLVVIYAVRHGIETIYRVCLLLLPLMVAFGLIPVALSLTNISTMFIRPFWGKGPAAVVITAFGPGIFAFLGYNVTYILIPFLTNRKGIYKDALLGLALPFVIYMIVVVLSILNFGEYIKDYLFPTLGLAINMSPVSPIFERTDTLFASGWLLSGYTTLIVTYATAAIILAEMWGHREFKQWVIPLAPLIYLIAVMPLNAAQEFKLLRYLGYLGLFVTGIVPWLLLLVDSVKRQRKNKSLKDAKSRP